MKSLKYGVLFVAAIALVLTACDKGPAKSKWTILAYYDGNNNIDEMANGTSAGIAEAQELEKIGSTSQVQIFAMIGAKKTGGGCKYYHVEKNLNELPDQFSSTELENLGAKDMSDKQVLRDFIVEGRTRYPAEKYVLLLFDHGGGWRGLLWDDVNGAGGGIEPAGLARGARYVQLRDHQVRHVPDVDDRSCLRGEGPRQLHVRLPVRLPAPQLRERRVAGRARLTTRV